jgi:formylglycine-generating enzyme
VGAGCGVVATCALGAMAILAAQGPPPRPVWDGKEPIATYAARAGLKTTATIDLGKGVTMPMVLVPPGQFEMKTVEKKGEPEKSFQKLTISRPFYVAVYPVTVGQFRRFVEETGYVTLTEKVGTGNTFQKGVIQQDVPGLNWRAPGFPQRDDHPAVLITWDDAQAFVRWLHGPTGARLRLPTEAEFFWAARGPQGNLYPWGPDWDGTRANYKDESFSAGEECSATPPTATNDGCPRTSPVGRYKNASWVGVFDLSGNIWQWCQDYFESDFFAHGPETDPQGPATWTNRVMRGGAYSGPPELCRTNLRNSTAPDRRMANIGFRVVMTLE